MKTQISVTGVVRIEDTGAIIRGMPYPRSVVFEACTHLGNTLSYHREFEDMVLRWELDRFAERSGIALHDRCRNLFRYLRDNPESRFEGRPLTDLVVEEAASRVWAGDTNNSFVHPLERAGHLIEDRQLRRTHPKAIDLPASDDEVHTQLNRHNFTVPLDHLNQAITAHGREIGQRQTVRRMERLTRGYRGRSNASVRSYSVAHE